MFDEIPQWNVNGTTPVRTKYPCSSQDLCFRFACILLVSNSVGHYILSISFFKYQNVHSFNAGCWNVVVWETIQMEWVAVLCMVAEGVLNCIMEGWVKIVQHMPNQLFPSLSITGGHGVLVGGGSFPLVQNWHNRWLCSSCNDKYY